MTACWAWLAPELSVFAQVIAYDRAGLGWSDEREDPRDARQIAEELSALLKALEIGEPAFLLGHSMGSIFNRAYLRQHPEALQGLIWLDPAHPEQIQRRGIQGRLRNLFFLHRSSSTPRDQRRSRDRSTFTRTPQYTSSTRISDSSALPAQSSSSSRHRARGSGLETIGRLFTRRQSAQPASTPHLCASKCFAGLGRVAVGIGRAFREHQAPHLS